MKGQEAPVISMAWGPQRQSPQSGQARAIAISSVKVVYRGNDSEIEMRSNLRHG